MASPSFMHKLSYRLFLLLSSSLSIYFFLYFYLFIFPIFKFFNLYFCYTLLFSNCLLVMFLFFKTLRNSLAFRLLKKKRERGLNLSNKRMNDKSCYFSLVLLFTVLHFTIYIEAVLVSYNTIDVNS